MNTRAHPRHEPPRSYPDAHGVPSALAAANGAPGSGNGGSPRTRWHSVSMPWLVAQTTTRATAVRQASPKPVLPALQVHIALYSAYSFTHASVDHCDTKTTGHVPGTGLKMR